MFDAGVDPIAAKLPFSLAAIHFGIAHGTQPVRPEFPRRRRPKKVHELTQAQGKILRLAAFSVVPIRPPKELGH
jgi:hypothetical protein